MTRHTGGLTELKTPPFLFTRKQELFLMHAHWSSADMVASEADRQNASGEHTDTASRGG